jgi:hypothetical protein
MQHLSENRAWPRIGTALGWAAGALLCGAALSQPNLAFARGHGGGGHGGGFHGGAVHAGGFHGGGFHHVSHGAVANVHTRAVANVHNRPVANVHNRTVAEVHNGSGYGHGDHWYHGWHNGRYGWWLWGSGLAWTYYNSQPYCSNPAGYYPYVTQCYTGWSG